MYKKALLFIIITVIISINCSANQDVRFFDLKRLLTAMGYENGEYVSGRLPMTVDSALYDYFHFPSVSNEKDREIINEEMPSNRLGALRLCSFILFRSALIPEEINMNNKFIDGIIDEIKEGDTFTYGDNGTFTREPIELILEEVTSFYNQALAMEIDEKMAETSLKSQIKSKIKPVLTEYFLTPTESKFLELKEVYYSYKNEVQFIDFIKLFSIDLVELLEAQDVPEFK